MLVVWKRSPMLRLLIPFVLGITTSTMVKVNVALIAGVFICFTITAAVIQFRKKKLHYNHRHIPAVLYAVIFFTLGGLLAFFSDTRIRPSFFSHFIQEESNYRLRLLDAPVEKEKSWKVLCEVINVKNGVDVVNASGSVLLYLQKDSAMQTLCVDDVLWCRSTPTLILSPKNPYEFDYATYQSRHRVYYQMYVMEDQWVLSSRPTRHSFMGYFITWREDLLAILKSSRIEEREFDVLAALVLGKSVGIDAELMSAYAGVGAVHVLAVSGLHVALIYVLLAPLMKRIFRTSKGRVFKTLVPILLLWIYAGITGFSPSVLRAALMFSFFIVADNYQKQNNIYNTMSASAFVLLVANPMMLFELGFQLSYLAVLGIVVLQQRITNLVYPKGKILLWMWKMTAVSVAAQIATFPITIFYFHQFPNYFLLSNFLVIPLSTAILYAALSFFALCWFPSVGNFLAQLSAFMTRLMNDLMVWMSSLPASITSGISISALEFLIITVALICCCAWLLWKKSRALIPLLFCIALLCSTQCVEKCKLVRQDEICFHSIKGADCITYIHGETGVVIGDNELMQDERRKKFHLQSYWDALGMKSKQTFHFDRDTIALDDRFIGNFPFIQLGSQRIVYVDSTSVQLLDSVQADFYIFDCRLYLKEKDLLAFIGKDIILGHQLKDGMRNYLWEKLHDQARIFDLRDGAVIARADSVGHFSKFSW
jgi:competence protein ComEC